MGRNRGLSSVADTERGFLIISCLLGVGEMGVFIVREVGSGHVIWLLVSLALDSFNLKDACLA